MNFDWTKPVVIDWSGRSGPLISEDDIKNSVIKRILRNQFYPPFCEREYISVKPWWNPQDPFGSQFGNKDQKHILFIPGLRPLPAYPQLSTLTKHQHFQGLKVMSTRFQFVQPRNYPKPTQKDFAAVEEFQAQYEAEQKEYLKWSKLLWMNGNCLRALRPKPTIERVYDAEFRMRVYEMLSMPQQYSMAAQIPLQKESGDCEMELEGDLINVSVQDLPMVDYPEEMEREFSVLIKSCPVPEPCKEHPCKFVLPHEETVSDLPLAEIHRELAQYAASNGSTFAASENSLQCLLDVDRSWKIPVSVIEVTCPESGDLKTIVVLGSEFNAQKECSMQRTYKAYKHLLMHTFAPSIGQNKSKSPTKQTTSPQKVTSSPPVNKEPVTLRNNRFASLDDDLEVSSDEDATEKLLIADSERKSEPKKLLDLREPTNEPDRLLINKNIEKTIDQCIGEPDKSHEWVDEPSSEPDRLVVDNHCDANSVPSNGLDSHEAFDQSVTAPDYSHEYIVEPSRALDRLLVNNLSDTVPSYCLDFYEPGYNKASTISNSNDEPFRLVGSPSQPESSCGLDFYQPDYNILTRPNYSRDDDDPSSEPDKLVINNPIKMNLEVRQDYKASCSRNSHGSNYDKPSYSNNEPSSEPDRIDSLSECNPETNSFLDYYELDRDTRQSNDEPSEPDQLTINDKNNSDIDDESDPELERNDDAAPIFKIIDETSQMLQTNDISETNADTLLEANKNLPTSLNSETNAALNLNTDKAMTTNTCPVGKPTKSIALIKYEDSEPTLGSKPNTVKCESQNAEAPKTPSPIKPCRISVRNLSISELKAFNVAALINSPKTEVPEKINSVTQINKDVSIINECPEKSTEGPARLGISGIITRNRSSILTNKLNNPVVEKTKHQKLEVLGIYKNQSSSKNSQNKSMDDSNTDNTKGVPTKIGISGMITRNRSISGTINVNEDVIEKSKEVTSKLETSRMVIRNQNARGTCKDTDPMIENAKEIPELGISGMITRNRSQSGTDKFNGGVIEKSKEASPKLEISSIFNRNQNFSGTCNDTKIKDSTIEKAKEIPKVGISGMITRNRSLSGTDNEDIAHTKKSKEVSPKLKTSGIINRNLTSPSNVSIATVRNIHTKIRQTSEVIEPVETNKLTAVNIKLQSKQNVCDKDEANEGTSNKSLELSPVKPCSVSVKPVDVEQFVRKRISETSVTGAEPVTEKFDKTDLKIHARNSEIDPVVTGDTEIVKTLKSTAKTITRKRSIVESNTEVPNIIEPHNRYANLKTYTRKSKKSVSAAKNKSPVKRSIKKSTSSIINSSIETKATSFLNDSNPPSTKRVKKLSKQVILEHDNLQIDENSKGPRKRSVSEIEHDNCASDPSFDEESVTDMLFIDFPPSVDEYTRNFDITEPNFNAPISNNKNPRNASNVSNNTSKETSSNTKTESRKISLSELFGNDSDCSEPMVIQNYDTASHIRKLSFSDLVEKPSTEKSPLKPCLKKSISDSPRNSKRKLSFSDPEINTSVSEPDSEDAFAGFLNGVPVPLKTLTKNIKKQQITVNRTYGLRSRNNKNPARTAEQSKEKGRFTKITPAEQINAINVQRRTSCSNSDSDDSNSISGHNSLTLKQNNNTNKQKNIENINLRRSGRLLRTNAANCNQLTSKSATIQTNATEGSEITKRLRRSRRFSDRSSAKENVQPKAKDTQNDLSMSLTKTSKIIKRDTNRRKSLPSNIFSETYKYNEILRSKSLTNLNEITDIRRTRHLSQSISYTTRSNNSNSLNKDRNDSLKLSERSKRYLRRLFNEDCSDSDQSDDEISQRTERFIRRSISLSSDAELSDAEIKTTKRCTRSSMASYSKETTKANRSRNKTYCLEKTKRYTRRSAAAYSSCDEMEQPDRVKRTITKRPGKVNTNLSTNIVSAESIAEQFEIDEIKTELMDTTDIVETFQIKIDVTEETDSVDNMASCEGNASQATKNEITDENFNMSNNMEYNETDVQETDKEFEFDDRYSTDARKDTNKTIEFNENSVEVQQLQNKNKKGIIAREKTLRNNSVDDDSESSDFFNMCVNDEFNILHFTATNDTDSEEESLTIDDSQSNTKATDVKHSKNDKASNVQPKTPQTEPSCNLSGESSNQITQARVENKTQTPRSKDESQIDIIGSDDLNRHNNALDKKSLSKDVNDVIGVFNCTCKGTPFEVPPPRSFKKWRVRNKHSQVDFNMIVHSSHRVRKGKSEVLLEPIVEYQPELGGSRQSSGRLRAIALSLMLRQHAALINVRIDHDNGNVMVVDRVSNDEFTRRHGDKRSELAHTLHTTLDQLRFLRPGHYVLAHDPSHGTNAMLYATKGVHDHSAGATLSLQQTNINMPDAEDALIAKIPPELDLVMLPYHKHRAILPLSFTPHTVGVREDKKMSAALARARPPPSAIQSGAASNGVKSKWPKKKKKSKKRSARQPQE